MATRAWILYLAGALSLVAALAHLWVTPEHFEEWWGYGVFFLVAALVQGLYGAALLRCPGGLCCSSVSLATSRSSSCTR